MRRVVAVAERAAQCVACPVFLDPNDALWQEPVTAVHIVVVWSPIANRLNVPLTSSCELVDVDPLTLDKVPPQAADVVHIASRGVDHPFAHGSLVPEIVVRLCSRRSASTRVLDNQARTLPRLDMKLMLEAAFHKPVQTMNPRVLFPATI